MQIHISRQGQQYGPYELEHVRVMLSQGQLLPTDMAWHEGMPDWVPLSQVAGTMDAGPPPQMMGPPMPTASPAAWASSARDWSIGDCLSDGWNAFKSNIGGCIGMLVVAVLIMGISNCVPFGAIFLGGPLLGGFFLFYIRQVRRHPSSIGTLFDGFKIAYGQLVLVALMSFLFTMLAMLPGIIVMLVGGAGYLMAVIDALKAAVMKKEMVMPALGEASKVFIMLGWLLMFVGPIFLQVKWLFTYPLVIDRRLGFWDAMKTSWNKTSGQWWKLFALLLLAQIIASAGIIGCGVGVLFTAPIALCALMACYVRNFDQASGWN